MSLSLDQYASFLDTRNLPWPAAPVVEPVKARPHLVRLPGVKAVLWGTYGTLVSIPLGEVVFEHPQSFVMEMALEKAIAEFKMWGSMSRKPGKPSEYLEVKYKEFLSNVRMATGTDRHSETRADKVWERVIQLLQKKEYKYDAGQMGALGEYAQKVAYFFHASLQGTGVYPGAGRALAHVQAAGLKQGLLGDGQCFTPVQLQRGLDAAGDGVRLDDVIPKRLQVLSWAVGAKKPSETLFKAALAAVGVPAEQVLHVGSRIATDIAPAKKLGMRTALFAGDKASLAATPEQLKDPKTKPDVLLTALEQIEEVV